MTVIIPSKQFSIEERRRLVLEYPELPHGSKAEFLETHQVGKKCPVTGLLEAFIPREDESHGSTEEIPGRAA